jgi:hypothetical protein
MHGACSTHRRRHVHTKCWSENMKERDHSEDIAVDGG